MTEPTSADPDALGRFVDKSGRVRGELSERAADFEGLVRWVEPGCVDFGVPGMAALVERLTALAVQWEVSETGVAAERRAVVGADEGLGPLAGSLPVVFDIRSLADEGRDGVADGLAADLVRAGVRAGAVSGGGGGAGALGRGRTGQQRLRARGDAGRAALGGRRRTGARRVAGCRLPVGFRSGPVQ